MPRVAHAVLINDFSGCAAQAVRRFFADQPVVTACPSRGTALADFIYRFLFPPARVAPRSFASLRRAPGVPGRAGRTLTAVELTMEDGLRQLIYAFTDALASGSFRGIGGLRGGRFSGSGRFDRYSYVPGVEISSVNELPSGEAEDLPSRLLLRVSGRAAAHGVLALDPQKGRISGRLGGRRVSSRFDLFELLFGNGALEIRKTQRCCRFIR